MVFNKQFATGAFIVIAQLMLVHVTETRAEKVAFDFYKVAEADNNNGPLSVMSTMSAQAAQAQGKPVGHVYVSGSSEYLYSLDANNPYYTCDETHGEIVVNQALSMDKLPEIPFIAMAGKCNDAIIRVTGANVKLQTLKFDNDFNDNVTRPKAL